MNFSSVGGNVTLAEENRNPIATAVINNVIVVSLCISINYINSILVHTFKKHQIFRVNPRYILFIHLVINDMMQLLISTVLHVISYVFYTINVSFCCFLLIITIFTTLNTPLNLACMAVECYIAVCIPLRHGQICTVKKTYIVICLIWGSSALYILPDLFILLATERIEFFNSKIICNRDYLFKNPLIVEKREVSYILLLVVVWFTLFYTYIRIMFAAKAATVDVSKARNTILLHGFQLLLCMITYVRHIFERVLISLIPSQIKVIMFTFYIFTQILPRFVSPIVYGLRDQTFRMYLKRYFCKTSTGPKTASVLTL